MYVDQSMRYMHVDGSQPPSTSPGTRRSECNGLASLLDFEELTASCQKITR